MTPTARLAATAVAGPVPPPAPTPAPAASPAGPLAVGAVPPASVGSLLLPLLLLRSGRLLLAVPVPVRVRGTAAVVMVILVVVPAAPTIWDQTREEVYERRRQSLRLKVPRHEGMPLGPIGRASGSMMCTQLCYSNQLQAIPTASRGA